MNVTMALLHIGFLTCISLWLWNREKGMLRRIFWPALLLKLCAGISLGLVYTYYYNVGDTFSYFEDGVKLAHLARTNFTYYSTFLWHGDEMFSISSALHFQQPRALFLSKITSAFCLFTGDNYWIIAVYFSFIGFVSAWVLTKKIIEIYPSAVYGAILSFLFFPSAVFWSSGLIKESLAMASLFFLSFLFLKIWQRERLHVTQGMIALASLWLLWNLKYYYLAVFLPVAITSLVIQFLLSRCRIRSLLFKLILWLLVFCFPLLIVSLLHPNFYIDRFMDVIVSSYYEFVAISNPDDVIVYSSLSATPVSLLQNIPWALFSGLFRPTILEVHNGLQFFIALENLILLALFIFMLVRWKKSTPRHSRLILFSLVVYTGLLCIFLTLSTPNFGTLSRYRVGFLPFLVFLLTIDNPLINKLMTSKIMQYLVR